MALTVDVEDGAARWRELLAEVEAGNEVVIARGAQPIARIGKVSPPVDSDYDSVVAAIRANRKNFAPTTIEEIIAWRDEDRR